MLEMISQGAQELVPVISVIGIIFGWLLQFKKMETVIKDHSKELSEFNYERKILLRSMLGVARRLKATGANGEITEVIDELEEYLICK